VERAKWDEFVQLFETHQKPVLDRLLDNGTIVEYGFDETSIHSDGGYTHSMWWVSSTLGNVENALQALEDAANQSDMDWAAQMETIGNSVTRHSDLLLNTIVYEMAPGSHPGAYFLGSTLQIKDGRMADFMELWKSNWVEIYEKLKTEGHVLGYGIDQQFIHTLHPNTRFPWVILSGPDGLTRMVQEFEKRMEEMDENSRIGLQSLFSRVAEVQHQDWMTKIIHLRVK
jgi:hypothetical protein